MFTLPNFCRVCLKYDKNLIDLAHIENEPSETLLSKLQLCVAEVEWEAHKPLLCHPCIKRLNIAYSFKKQAVQSAGVLKNYVELVKESQKKAESQLKPENPPNLVPPGGGAYMLLPNQKYVKILVGGQTQATPNTFQNVFLNLIPTATGTNATLNTTNPPPLTITPTVQKQNSQQGSKQDSNQNMFLNALNLSQAIQKLLPSSVSIDQVPKKKASRPTVKAAKEEDIEEMLEEDNAEEMSVEIDPTSFLQVEHDAGSSDEEEEKEPKDWDNIITQQKVDPAKVNGEKINGKDSNYVSVLPKQAQDFFSGQHFLSNSFDSGHHFTCNTCSKSFPTQKLLKQHMKNFHMASKIDYEACQRLGLNMSADSALTLKDFVNADDSLTETLNLSMMDLPADLHLLPNEKGQYVCTVCNRIFTNSAGLLRHKVRKHQQKNRKKYFIKGMKNARCDICNREFSTQSYMQMHRKLHLRDDTGGYKFKVLGKSKYDGIEDQVNEGELMPKQKRGRKPKSWHQQNSGGSTSIKLPKVKGKRGRKRRVMPVEFHQPNQVRQDEEEESSSKKPKLDDQIEQTNPEGENSNSSNSESDSSNSNDSKPENGKEQTEEANNKEENDNDSSSDSESDSSSSSSDEEDEDGGGEGGEGEGGEGEAVQQG